MKIPKEFKILDTTFKVEFNNDGKLASEEQCEGMFYQGSNKILIQQPNSYYSEQSAESTFYHELTHAILFTLGFREENENETFVDLLGRALRQFQNTAVY